MKKIVFLTGTRADFGKLKPLIKAVEGHQDYEYHIFATGMHLQEKYGYTVIEIEKSGFLPIYKFDNHTAEATMDLTLAKTIQGFSVFVKSYTPDLILIHGDRVEALAGAIVGSLNNILVGHIEGGEISGTVDELIRHSISKLSHIHFVSHNEAATRLIQMGELPESIFTIGSPDLDVLFGNSLPNIKTVKEYYEIPFKTYAVVLYHPVVTEDEKTQAHAKQFVDALLQDDTNYIVIYPNNDKGSSRILKQYERFDKHTRFKVFPSLRFEYFITLLKQAKFLIGNSSAGIHEAPYLSIPSINIGRRQENRDVDTSSIFHVNNSVDAIKAAIHKASTFKASAKYNSMQGKSAHYFLDALDSKNLWLIDHQKQFKDL